MRIRAKKPSRAPAIIAPRTLVAAKVIARRITANKAAPRIAISSTDSILQTQSRVHDSLINDVTIKVIAR